MFKAEEILEKGRNFHKKCFTCKTCKRPQSDKLQVYVGPDEDIYCKSCCPKIEGSGIFDQDTTKIRGEEGAKDSCPRCGGKVFEAEKFASKGQLYHKKCFTCFNCKSHLSLSSMFETPNNNIACRTCYVQTCFTGGKNHFMDYSNVKEIDGEGVEHGSDKCPACKVVVYEAEKVKTRCHVYHRKCLGCNDCGRLLDTSNFFDGRNGLIYCRTCYATE